MNFNLDNLNLARTYLSQAVKLSPKESVFYSDLSEVSANIALGLYSQGEKETAIRFIESSINESKKAEEISPKNVNIKRKSAANLINLSVIDPTYLKSSQIILLEAIKLAPTDAKLYYNLGLTYAKLNQMDKALEVFDKTIEMKPNYRHARFAKALLLSETGKKEEAKAELIYILERIDPNDSASKQLLEEISG
jgi:tetratricopeptide (TPR) repeat protein